MRGPKALALRREGIGYDALPRRLRKQAIEPGDFETDQRPQRLYHTFPGGTLTRLSDLKARYDPDGVFRGPQSVGSSAR